MLCYLSLFSQQHMAGSCPRDWGVSGSSLSVEAVVMLRICTEKGDHGHFASVARMVTMDASALVFPMSASYTGQNVK